MDRCIFIIEDKLTDIAGCLLTLQTILNSGFKDPQKNDMKNTRLCFMHICGDDETQKAYESRFQNAFRHSQEVMEKNAMLSLDQAEYIAIPLKQDTYTAQKDGADKLAEEIIDKQRKYLKKWKFSSKFVQDFPNASGNDAAYVLLLDIILTQKDNVDQERIQNCQPVLSSCLYTKFPKNHCITYTNYSEYYGDKWADLAGIVDEEIPIERERLTRARAIYTPLKTRLYHALCL